MTETAARHHDRSAPEAEIVAALGRRAIVLVGMMGSGKSTIGRGAARGAHPVLGRRPRDRVAHCPA